MQFLKHSEFNILKKFKRIAVVGPIRSGTKIVANMICYEIEYDFVKNGLMRHDDENGILLFKRNNNIVLHNPEYLYICNRISGPDTAIVFVWRNVDDIRKSREKLSRSSAPLLKGIGLTEGDPGVEKQKFWKEKIYGVVENTFNVRFEDMSEHKLWVGREERKDFRRNHVSASGKYHACEGVNVWRRT